MNDLQISVDEAVQLGASDTIFFGQYFFPNACRQASPQFHYDIVDLVEDNDNRLAAVKIFRGGAKTTLLRVILGKRIAYGISHTILVVSETADHSVKTLRWLRTAVLHNALYRDTFGLKPGAKWTDGEIEIYSTVLDCTINVVGSGIFGQTRGLNIDDRRPDFILLDDIHDDENARTPEMRKKVKETLYGAILRSLAPTSECPTATACMLQTPLQREDAIEEAMKDDAWASMSVSILNEANESNWPERWTTEEILKDKESYRQRNQMSVWYREMEVKVTADELAFFSMQWLNNYENRPEGGYTYLGIDPTPPPKESQELGSGHRLDDAVICAILVRGKNVYLLDYYKTKSPNPNEFVEKIFEFHQRYKPLRTGLETVLFQRVIKNLIETAQQRKRYYFAITPVEDRRKKSIRIRQEVTDWASAGAVYVNKRKHTAFMDQYAEYPDVSHDDILDAFAIALSMIQPAALDDYIEGEWEEVEDLLSLDHIEHSP